MTAPATVTARVCRFSRAGANYERHPGGHWLVEAQRDFWITSKMTDRVATDWIADGSMQEITG